MLACLLTGCGKDKRAADTEVTQAESRMISEPLTLTVGHVGHDHHTALFVAADRAAELARGSGISMTPIEDRKHYELFDNGRKIADLRMVKVGGGSKMPTALAQGVIEVGLGGVAAVLAAVDKGTPVRMIAPLHFKGDMFVVKPDFPAKTWQEFVARAKAATNPIRIGYKSPIAVAKLVFEEALKHEGVTFSGDPAKRDAKVLMVNVKGGGKLNAALSGGLVEGYVGNNPFPAIGAAKGLLRIVCDLEGLPPGTFSDHPCCCVASTTAALRDKAEAITALLVLMLQATETINTELPAAADVAARWIGTTPEVERTSIATSGYSMDASKTWRGHMAVWIDAMDGLGVFENQLKGLKEQGAAALVYDFSLLKRATAKLAAHPTAH